MIDYLTQMPPSDTTHDRGHKFPFLANQIFQEGGKGVENIVEHFFYKKFTASPNTSDLKKSGGDNAVIVSPSVIKENPFKTQEMS